jgi:hypothetical protein
MPINPIFSHVFFMYNNKYRHGAGLHTQGWDKKPLKFSTPHSAHIRQVVLERKANMKKKGWFMIFVSLLTGLVIFTAFLFVTKLSTQGFASPVVAAAEAPTALTYHVLAWNDLGMHCYNADFSDLAVLPPYNTLWAQVVLAGDPPTLVTTGIEVTYIFTDNTYSVGKSNFWTYAQQLFGLPVPLAADIGLTGRGLAGTMSLAGDHFVAEGIPLTEYSDSAPTLRNPYQLAQITVKDSATQAVLAQTVVVAPVSTEMHCDNCHSDDGDATMMGEITPTGKVERNILTLHDKLSMANYPPGHTGALMDRRPVLCAECHSSNALGAAGVAGVKSLSNAMHTRHSGLDDITPDSDGCYNCHPGPVTQCLRDVMSQEEGMTCISCHGEISQVAMNQNPWLNEPRCDTCHGLYAAQNQPLYRHSTGHGGLYCESCHDSTHAIATSREPRDAIKFIALQGHAGTLEECSVCHTTAPSSDFLHLAGVINVRMYLPMLQR